MDTVVLAAGGFYGFTYLGILQANKDMWKNATTFIGSSIGGIIATLLVLNYTPLDIMLRVLYKCEDGKISLIQSNIITMLCDLIIPNTLTFIDLYDYSKKTLIITSYDMELKKCIYYSYITHPDKLVIEAVKETANNNPFSPKLFFDGLLCSPFPIKYCRDYKYESIFGIVAVTSESNNKDICIGTGNIYNRLRMMNRILVTRVIELELYLLKNNDIVFIIDRYLAFELYEITFKWAITMYLDGLHNINIYKYRN